MSCLSVILRLRADLELSPRSASLRFFTLHLSMMVPSEIVTLFTFLLLFRCREWAYPESIQLCSPYEVPSDNCVSNPKGPLAALVLLCAKLVRSAALSMFSLTLFKLWMKGRLRGSKEEYPCINCSGVQSRICGACS